MKALKWIFGILVSLVIILAALVAIDISPYFALISADHPTPQPYRVPSGVKIKLRSDIVSLTASEMAHKIREKELSSVEVVEAHLSQIYQFNPQVNAIVTLDAERALRRAREADQALAAGQLWGPLHGVPFTIKDHIATKSMNSTVCPCRLVSDSFFSWKKILLGIFKLFATLDSSRILEIGGILEPVRSRAFI